MSINNIIRKMIGREGYMEDRLTQEEFEMAKDALSEKKYQTYAFMLMRQMDFSQEEMEEFFADLGVTIIL